MFCISEGWERGHSGQPAPGRAHCAPQVVMRVAPPSLLAELHRRFLRGALPALAEHPAANFVVQAYLAAITESQQAHTLTPRPL